MIDVYNPIYTKLATELRLKFPDIFVTGDEVTSVQSKFPAVSITEDSNLDNPASMTNGDEQEFAVLTWTTTAYSNLSTGRVAQAREIAGALDVLMRGMNFTKVSHVPQSNLYNNSTYRIRSTYTVKVDREGNLYRV